MAGLKTGKNILLLDGQTIQALPFLSSLKKKGHNVTVFCDSRLSYGYCSRFADQRIIVPKWTSSPEEYKDLFFDYIRSNSVDVVIPLYDDSATFVSQNKEELEKYTHCIIPEYDVFRLGFEKNLFMKFCRSHDFFHPVTADLELESLESAAKIVGFPAILKPNITNGARGMKRINCLEDLKACYEFHREQFGPSHLQQYIAQAGTQYSVHMFTDQKEICRATVIEKRRLYPEAGGTSSCSVSIENDEMVDSCKSVLNKLNWIGFADFDLIRDPVDNQVKFLELNPRVAANIRASFLSGVDFAEIITNYTLNEPVQEYKYKPGIYVRNFGLDMIWFLKSKKRFSADPGWFNFFGRNIYYQDGSYKDPLPLIAGALSGLLKLLSPRFREEKSGMSNH